jgi:hypothetical protein
MMTGFIVSAYLLSRLFLADARDGSVGMEFMTDTAEEAEEMRELYLTFECVADARILDEPDWVSL